MTASVRAGLLLALVVVLGLAVFQWTRPARAQPLAYTECPFTGSPRVTVTANVVPEDSMPVRMHEDVHAGQCRQLGPIRYRIRNLSTSGRLSLEAPAYCAGARGRLAQRMNPARALERMLDDAKAAFAGRADSLVANALRRACPDLFLAARALGHAQMTPTVSGRV